MGHVTDVLAPCSLCCGTCPAFIGGVVEQSAKQLRRYLQGYEAFNRQNLPPEYRGYMQTIGQFMKELDGFAAPRCHGCRDNTHGKCCIENCTILACTREHGVEFCAECAAFPCEQTSGFLKPEVLEQWRAGNERIRQVGAEKYAEEAMRRSHYQAYAETPE